MEKITIDNERRSLSKDGIEKMIREAEEYEDKEFKKKSNACKKLEDYLYEMSNKINDGNVRMKVSAEMLKDMENTIVDTTKWLKDNHDAPLSELELKKDHLKFLYGFCILKILVLLPSGSSSFCYVI
ncbi:luminal-binding protein 3-like [Rutidosis leptorrhynchoides]|uniref:luminal-binding protein 3-like n=1 Tax=Rutidosis leptorrhynchoides TaxID=125765 RepID=UPI003A997B5E